MEIGSKTFQEFVDDQLTNFCIVVTGAGGSLEDWVNGIDGELKHSSITSANNCFIRAYTLSDNILGKEGRVDLVLVFDPAAKPDMGKMAIWRIGWQGGISWAEDFIANYGKQYGWRADEDEPDEDEIPKPFVQLTGNDGNVFGIIGACSKALKRAGQEEKSKEFTTKAFNAGSYEAVLSLAMEYCDVA
jgi:hypothetical protein